MVIIALIYCCKNILEMILGKPLAKKDSKKVEESPPIVRFQGYYSFLSI
jgi:hypothetical protein